MEKKKLVIIISIILTFLIFVSAFVYRQSPKRNFSAYSNALETYNKTNFKKSYRMFKKVSIFSELKPASVYRQALCAKKLDDKKAELRKYEQIKKYYSNSKIAPKAVYTLAKEHYKQKKYSKAIREFKFVIKKYPKTEYATASQYFIALGIIEKTKNNPNKEREIVSRLKKYLVEAPDGIYALSCAKVLEKYTLSDEENLLVGQTYLKCGDYRKAEIFLKKADKSISWPYLVQVYSKLKNNNAVRAYTKNGLSSNPTITTKKYDDAVYNAIDLYLKTFDNKKTGLDELLTFGRKSRNYDYIMFKKCQSLNDRNRALCYSSLWHLYPKGNFAAESLSYVFYDTLKKGDYNLALRQGKTHLRDYGKVKSTPKVLYWLAYTARLLHYRDQANYYYKRLMKEYPDDYYTYLAFMTTNKLKYFKVKSFDPKPVEFPYADTNEKFLKTLLKVNDFGLINSFYGDDDFIKSWIMYKEGNYSNSSRLARDAMEKLDVKPDSKDLRWRLVYPVHFIDEITNNNVAKTPLILSIIREESYFNTYAKSPVGAMGLMQLMPSTAKEIAEKNGLTLLNNNFLYDPKINIKLGKLYLAFLENSLSGRTQLAILAYNGGIGVLKQWKKNIDYDNFDDFVEQIPYSETQNYYKKVYRSYWNYLRIYNGLNF